MDLTSVNSTTTQNETVMHSRREQCLSSETLEDRERRLASTILYIQLMDSSSCTCVGPGTVQEMAEEVRECS